MDQRGIISLEVKKEERTYQFLMPIGSPFVDAHEAALAFVGEIQHMAQKAADAETAREAAQEAAKKEVPKASE